MILIINSAGVLPNKIDSHSKYLPFPSAIVVNILKQAGFESVHHVDLRNRVSPYLTTQLIQDDFDAYLSNDEINSRMEEYFNLSLDCLPDLNKIKIIGFSIFSHINYAYGLALAKYINSEYPEIRIIFGGGFITVKDLEFPTFIDYFVKGSPTTPLLAIVNHVFKKEPISTDVQGVIYRKDDKIVIRKQNRESAQDEPLPDYTDLPLNNYLSFDETSVYNDYENVVYNNNENINYQNTNILRIPYRTNMGCNLGCSFCTGRLIDKLSFKDKDKVVNDLITLSKLYKNSVIEIWDASFNSNPNLLKEILSELINKNCNISYITEANMYGMDEELLELMKESGCKYILWGLEAMSEQMINYYKKKYNPEEAYKIIRKASEFGLVNEVGFIYNGPTEQIDDIYAMRDFVYAFVFDENVLFTFNEFYLEERSSIQRHPDRFNIKIIERPEKDKYYNRESIVFVEKDISVEEYEKKKSLHKKIILSLKNDIRTAKAIKKFNDRLFGLIPQYVFVIKVLKPLYLFLFKLKTNVSKINKVDRDEILQHSFQDSPVK